MTRLLRRLRLAYYNRYACCKPVRLSRWERWLKLRLYDLIQIHADDFQLFLIIVCLACVWYWWGGVR